MGKIVKNYIYNGLYQIFIIIVPLITAPYLARVLGATNMGVYSYVNSTANLIVNIGLLGVYDYGNRQIAYYRDDDEKISKIFFELVFLRLILTVFITLFYVIFVAFSQYKIFFILYFPWILANCLDCSWLFVGVEDMGATCLKNFLAKLCSVLCIFIFVKSKSDLWIYIFSFALCVFLGNTVVYVQLHKYVHKVKISFIGSISHLKGALQFFLPQIAMLIYLQIDKVMIASILKNTSYVAFYDQAEKLIQIPLSLITVVSTVMMPRIANEYKRGNYQSVKKYVIGSGTIMLMAAFPLMFGLAGIASEFIPWYLGVEFHPSIVAMIALCPIVIANALSGLAGKQYLTATNQMNSLFKSYFITAIVNIVLNCILINTIGWIGAILATDISAICCAFIQIKYMSKSIKVIYIILRKSLISLFYAILMFFIIRVIGNNLGADMLTTLIQIVVGIIIFISGLLISRDDTLMLVIDYFKKLMERKKC